MSTSQNLPEKFLARLEELYPQDVLSGVLRAYEQKIAPSFRVNTLKATTDEVRDILFALGYEITPVSWYKDAFVMHNKSIRELTETDIYIKGCIYIQNLSSMIPALVMDPQRDEKILDIAAAPGSKTTQIAALMQNTGELTANDLSYKRLFKLRENISQAGVTNAKVLNLPGESFWKQLPEYFDRTLVDVPCSMEGRMLATDPKTYKDWSTKKVKQLSKLQKYLLRSAISCTKPGGTIVYSTCTLSPEENEEVVEWAIEKANGAVVVEKIVLPEIPLMQGLTQWRKKTFNHVANTARVVPSLTMEGFYIAKLHKISSTLPI
ncbi:MAG: RsmB/NOP family class I SAM-dependent RNA methyltransferase [Candidatus Levybacteria bacterium]|nr:RsmB/NOP family class I SAM-dependent RNA methyltransferase [Candidatus Levybacteria bacterium]